jgi:hypothetical protein
MPGNRRLLAAAIIAALACAQARAQALVAPRDSRQLQSFRAEAEAFNRQDPFANAYRAGHYNGYIAGILDGLQGRSVCFRDCVCEIDKLVDRHLAEHPAAGDRPVVDWLIPLLQAKYPCGN